MVAEVVVGRRRLSKVIVDRFPKVFSRLDCWLFSLEFWSSLERSPHVSSGLGRSNSLSECLRLADREMPQTPDSKVSSEFAWQYLLSSNIRFVKI